MCRRGACSLGKGPTMMACNTQLIGNELQTSSRDPTRGYTLRVGKLQFSMFKG